MTLSTTTLSASYKIQLFETTIQRCMLKPLEERGEKVENIQLQKAFGPEGPGPGLPFVRLHGHHQHNEGVMHAEH